MKTVPAIRKLGGKKHGSLKTTYPSEERLNTEFIKEVECSRQDVLNGKGSKFNSVDDFFNSLEK